jgi:hypothetical protein
MSRLGFHDKINNEQQLLIRADGKWIIILHILKNDEINLRSLMRFLGKVDELQNWVETTRSIAPAMTK